MVSLMVALLEYPEHVADVRGCLEGAGHEVCLVDSFARATEILRAQSFDLIISDVHLENGGNVFDFLRWVRSQKYLRAVPFVLFSLGPNDLERYLADGIRTAGRQLGADKYICMEKFNSALLFEEIADLLSGDIASQVLTKEGA
jgi:CheY-like chemotaxis protein